MKRKKYFQFLLSAFFKCIIFMAMHNSSMALNSNHIPLDNQIQMTVNRDMIQYNLPNISVSISLPGDRYLRNYVSGYYTLADDRKIKHDSLFRMGSITKTFTASIIYQLIEKNKLSLTDTVGKWFPQYPRWKNVTVNDLLLNTSGIYDYVHNDNDVWHDLKENPHEKWRMEELTDLAYKYPDYFSPGKGYHYSNTDYVLLGMIIEKVTKKNISQVFQEFFNKSNLNNTHIDFKLVPKNNLAHGYNRDGTFSYNKDVTFVNTTLGQSDGAIISSTNDIIKWLIQLFNINIVSAESLNKMMALISSKNGYPLTENICSIKRKFLKQNDWIEIGTGSAMGLVYFKQGGFNWVHSGGISGYEAFYAYNPCRKTYLVLSYGAKPKDQYIFMKVANDIFSVINQSSRNKTFVGVQKKSNLPSYCDCDDTVK